MKNRKRNKSRKSRKVRNKMNTVVARYVRSLNRRTFTNNVQRVLHTLLIADGEWVSRTAFRVPSAAARLRDLRKDEYGAFDVVCSSAFELDRNGSSRTFYYRLNTGNMTLAQVREIFQG